MNVLLGIKKDVDIVYKTPPSAEEVEAFEAETGDGPVLDPMHLSFDVPASHIWNNDLAEQFVEQFMHQHEVDESEEGLIHELFTTHYTCLKRRYNEWRPKEGEGTVQRGQHVKAKNQMERKFQRKDTRRNKVRKISIFRKIEFTSWL